MRHIVADKGCVILPHRDRGVVERRQRVRLDVADLGGVAFQAIHDIADMFTVQFALVNKNWTRKLYFLKYNL